MPPIDAPGAGAWSVTEGACAVDGNCVTSPNFPSPYADNQGCSISVQANGQAISVEDFQTEGNYDILFVNGEAFSGSNGPAGKYPSTGVPITWTSDYSVTSAGWKICLEGGGGSSGGGSTMPPTMAPTEFPTDAPEPFPTDGPMPTDVPTSPPGGGGGGSQPLPTDAPTMPPTMAPTEFPTDAPEPFPTDGPMPTDAPTSPPGVGVGGPPGPPGPPGPAGPAGPPGPPR